MAPQRETDGSDVGLESLLRQRLRELVGDEADTLLATALRDAGLEAVPTANELAEAGRALLQRRPGPSAFMGALFLLLAGSVNAPTR